MARPSSALRRSSKRARSASPAGAARARLSWMAAPMTRAAAESTPTGDSLRLAVLAALNIADELFRCRDTTRQKDGQLAERAGELERLVDRVLMA